MQLPPPAELSHHNSERSPPPPSGNRFLTDVWRDDDCSFLGGGFDDGGFFGGESFLWFFDGLRDDSRCGYFAWICSAFLSFFLQFFEFLSRDCLFNFLLDFLELARLSNDAGIF